MDYVNANYDIRQLYTQVMHRDAGYGKCFCPFHENMNTPAAKIYDNVLKCFGACGRSYFPFDFLKTFFPDELDRIQGSIILKETSKELSTKIKMLHRKDLDLTKPIDEVIGVIFANAGVKEDTEDKSFLGGFRIATDKGIIGYME